MSERLAVLGSPIAHSKSPDLHLAAYGALGLDWTYERIEVTADQLADFLNDQGSEFRGFSATMPLKQELLRLATEADLVARTTGAANTAFGMREGQLRVTNTDVAGIVNAFRHAGVDSIRDAAVLGSGATAASAVAALADLGAESVSIRVRDPHRAHGLEQLANSLGMRVAVNELSAERDQAGWPAPDALISTLPARAVDQWASRYAPLAPVLLDVAYEPWPSALASAASGATVISGLEMLLQQALIQVRIFVAEDPFAPLAGESAVLQAMRSALPALCQD